MKIFLYTTLRAMLVLATFLQAAALTASELPNLDEFRFRSDSFVLERLGEPQRRSEAIGTHASYSLWTYPNFTVAFANRRVIHVFSKDSLRRVELVE